MTTHTVTLVEVEHKAKARNGWSRSMQTKAQCSCGWVEKSSHVDPDVAHRAGQRHADAQGHT